MGYKYKVLIQLNCNVIEHFATRRINFFYSFAILTDDLKLYIRDFLITNVQF